MNYTTVLNLINTNLASSTNITAEEHREVEIALLNYAQTQNNYVGYITGVNLPIGDGVDLSIGGAGITSAVGTASNGVLITLTTPMESTNYYVRSSVESLGSQSEDTQVAQVLFKKISTTQFYYRQAETGSATQNLRIHFEVISLD